MDAKLKFKQIAVKKLVMFILCYFSLTRIEATTWLVRSATVTNNIKVVYVTVFITLRILKKFLNY